MNRGIAVDFARRRLENLAAKPLGKTKYIDCAMNRRLGRLNRVVLIVDRRSWTGQIVDLVDLELERVGHIVPHEFETGVSEQVLDVDFPSSEKVVDCNDVMAISQQTIAQMRAEEPGAAGNENAHTGRD